MLCDHMACSAPGLPVPRFLLKSPQVRICCISDTIQSSHPLAPSSSASIFRSVRDFSSESSVHIRWPKYWSFNFSISPSNEYSGLISLKIDWFDLLAVQGTFRSLLQHQSSKVSILWRSSFFMVQLSQLYVTTGRTIALTLQTFVGRVMSLRFNTLSRFLIAGAVTSSDFTAAVTVCSDVRAQEKEICHHFHLLPFYCHAIETCRNMPHMSCVHRTRCM